MGDEDDRSPEDDRVPRRDGVDATIRPRAEIAAENAAVEELYENAPCGYLSTLPDGTIVKINATLVGWLGHHREDLVGRRRFADLLTVGGRIYYETHFAPLMNMQNSVREVAVDMATADGRRIPVLITAALNPGNEHGPAVVRCTVFDAHDRRAYERELLRARQDADRERERMQRLATVLQRSLLPPQLPTIDGVDTAAYYHPASLDEVGGDFYDLWIGSASRTAAVRSALNRVLVHNQPEEPTRGCELVVRLARENPREMEEVGGQQPGCLGSQEGAPVGVCPARRRAQVCGGQDAAKARWLPR